MTLFLRSKSVLTILSLAIFAPCRVSKSGPNPDTGRLSCGCGMHRHPWFMLPAESLMVLNGCFQSLVCAGGNRVLASACRWGVGVCAPPPKHYAGPGLLVLLGMSWQRWGQVPVVRDEIPTLCRGKVVMGWLQQGYSMEWVAESKAVGWCSPMGPTRSLQNNVFVFSLYPVTSSCDCR